MATLKIIAEHLIKAAALYVTVSVFYSCDAIWQGIESLMDSREIAKVNKYRISYGEVVENMKEEHNLILDAFYTNHETIFSARSGIYLSKDGFSYYCYNIDNSKGDWGLFKIDHDTLIIDTYSSRLSVQRDAFEIMDSCTIRRLNIEDKLSRFTYDDWRLSDQNNVFVLNDSIAAPDSIPEKELNMLKW